MFTTQQQPFDKHARQFVTARPGRLPAEPLTRRELQTLELLARGFSYAEIAAIQQVSVSTTRTHLKSVYAKLDVHSKNEAVFEGLSLGLLAQVVPALPYHGRRGYAGFDSTTINPQPGPGTAGLLNRT